jgi:hypothetical protein
MSVKSRVSTAAVLGTLLSVVIAQQATALCIAQPLQRLMKESDSVWWGTVTSASAAPSNGAGTWALTVRVDDVLKGEGARGDTKTVYTYSCGPMITPSMAEVDAQSFVGEQRLFLVSLDHQGRQVAYSDIVSVAGNTHDTAEEQYTAALAIVGQAGQGGVFAGTPISSDPSVLAIVAPFVLMLAAMLIAAVIYFVRRRRSV